MNTYQNTFQRVSKFRGEIIAHAAPFEVLARQGRAVERSLPQNESDTYAAKRWLLFGQDSTNANTMNQFFANGSGDRGAAFLAAHQVQEGVTPLADQMRCVEVLGQIQQLAVLYGFTDKMSRIYEDKIDPEAKRHTGERMGLVREQLRYGVLRGCTNVFYGGVGTSMATVNGPLTTNLLRKATQSLQANHAAPITRVLSASAKYATDPVQAGYVAIGHTDLETSDLLDLPNFTTPEKYASGTPMDNESGKQGRIRFLTSPDLPPFQNAGAAVGATGLYSTGGSNSNIDIYPIIILGADAWSHIALRGLNALKTTHIPVGQASAADAFGQRGYVGAMCWDGAMIENHGWMAVIYVGRKAL